MRSDRAFADAEDFADDGVWHDGIVIEVGDLAGDVDLRAEMRRGHELGDA
jgi:hypothetical protein